jgi:hypothetical protein
MMSEDRLQEPTWSKNLPHVGQILLKDWLPENDQCALISETVD